MENVVDWIENLERGDRKRRTELVGSECDVQ